MANYTQTLTFPAGVATWVRDCADLSGCKVTINNTVTYEVNHCGDFGVYYVGKLGGWNSFLFEGICKRTDNITEHKYNRFASNQTIDFENNRYMTEIVPTYELHTGWLSDEEAARLASDLIPTNKMYLHNLTTDEIRPAIITNTTAEYKTFRNNNRKFVQYTITVQESQTRIRR